MSLCRVLDLILYFALGHRTTGYQVYSWVFNQTHRLFGWDPCQTNCQQVGNTLSVLCFADHLNYKSSHWLECSYKSSQVVERRSACEAAFDRSSLLKPQLFGLFGFDANCICKSIFLHQLTLTNAIDLQINFESVNTHQECFRIWCIGFECRVAQFQCFKIWCNMMHCGFECRWVCTVFSVLKYDAMWCIGFECRGVCTVFSVLEYDALARDAVQYFIRGNPPLTPPPFPCTAQTLLCTCLEYLYLNLYLHLYMY